MAASDCKPSRQFGRWIPKIIGIGLLSAIASISVRNYQETLVRPKVLYLISAMLERKYDNSVAIPKSDYGAFSAGELDSDVTTVDMCDKSTSLTLADPFNTKKLPGEKRHKIEVLQEGCFNGEPVDFTFSGNALRYFRCSRNSAILYSYGPDEDDDIVALRSELQDVASTSTKLVNVLYDSTNGTISNGDIWMEISSGFSSKRSSDSYE